MKLESRIGDAGLGPRIGVKGTKGFSNHISNMSGENLDSRFSRGREEEGPEREGEWERGHGRRKKER